MRRPAAPPRRPSSRTRSRRGPSTRPCARLVGRARRCAPSTRPRVPAALQTARLRAESRRRVARFPPGARPARLRARRGATPKRAAPPVRKAQAAAKRACGTLAGAHLVQRTGAGGAGVASCRRLRHRRACSELGCGGHGQPRCRSTQPLRHRRRVQRAAQAEQAHGAGEQASARQVAGLASVVRGSRALATSAGDQRSPQLQPPLSHPAAAARMGAAR
jgi:hypothetical protein